MQQWEYDIYSFNCQRDDFRAHLQQVLNRLGEQGWELASTHPSGPDWVVYVFKRPKQ